MSVRVHAGTSGFSYDEWKGPFYPEKLPKTRMLAYYGERLDTVEIGNTFYRMPKAAMLEKWAASTPAGFRFVLKASRRITHRGRIADVQDSVDYLFSQAEALGEKLGPVLFQLPPYLKKDVPRLRRFLEGLPEGRRAAVEFRSRSWYDDEVFEALRDHGAALVLADWEDASKTAPLLPTGSFGYFRLRRPDYGEADLDAWAARILAQPWEEAFVFFKHEDEGAAPRLALRFLERVAEAERASSTVKPVRKAAARPKALRKADPSGRTGEERPAADGSGTGPERRG